METAAVCALISFALPVFVTIADSLGGVVDVSPSRIAGIVVSVLIFHAAYWRRQRWAAIPDLPRNTLLHHLFLFLSRLSFIFAAAFFSLVAFRHLPALQNPLDLSALVARGALLLAALFSMFCYSLEFDRLARAMDEPSPPGG
ncbi:hypothetical protein [Hansschlegelia zhihuaiae]|uniref:Uncharacterized protein n=1 Tax=Hansschlegelia zhihuaiae TaxID=405005 RepID=A0A4Q0MHD8_9HYPH|nr:hypothetical protein [Hansschlegelia zhihuaiae]RXF72987.1 hypothetical protein EK403_12665 [Hansschlegelia zhihuaiae]